jgi:hypothetical protein
MTQEEMIRDVFEALGEPSDLEYRDPVTGNADVTTPGWIRMSQILNEAQRKIAFHVFTDGRRMRMRSAETIGRLVTRVFTDVLAGVSGNSIVLTGAFANADTYRGFLVTGATSGASGVVFASVAPGTLYLSALSGTFVNGETVTLYQREYSFADSNTATPFTPGSIWFDYTNGRPVEITGIAKEDGTELDLAESADKWTQVATTSGEPTAYKKFSGGVRFEIFPDATYYFLVRAMREPTPMVSTLTTDEPEIGQAFHRAMVLYAQWWFLMRNQETSVAYGVRRTYEDLLRQTQTELDLEARGQSGIHKFYTEGR